MKKQKRDLLFYVEISIILVIAVCMIFLNIFMENKIDELQQSAQDAVFVMEDLNYPAENALMEDIKEYIPSTYKMIEIYDENFNCLMKVQFDNKNSESHNIQDSIELMNSLRDSPEGQTTYNVGSIEQSVYFKWLTNTNGERRLMIIYSTVMDVQNLWVFSLVSYLVIILAFALLGLLRYKAQAEAIRNYHDIVRLTNDDPYDDED